MSFSTLLLAAGALSSAYAQLSSAELDQRIARAIEATAGSKVVLEDVLGEGPGSWDPDPRYPNGTVNCIIWLQQVIAETYGTTAAEKTQVMDRLRYFAGVPAFGLRKHYTDHWVAIEPQPLRRVDLSSCAEVSQMQIELKPTMFLKHSGYSCPLLHQEWTRFTVAFVKPDGIRQCAKKLGSGHYMMFAVPTDSYMKKYLHETGPMAFVHAMILRLKDGQGPRVLHASTSKGKVLQEPIEEFLRKSGKIHHGYVLYELDPTWSLAHQPPAPPEAALIQACEAKLPAGQHH